MIVLNADAWEKRYQEGQDYWDLGCPAPPLINLLRSAHAPNAGRIAVLGCGSGHDAMLFATVGFDVVGFDFAPSAIARARTIAEARELDVQFLQRNIFELEAEFIHSFDYVLEHTCFCTLALLSRSQYVQVVKNLLRPNGQLIALFFTHRRTDAPPYGIDPAAILDLFTPHFDVIRFEAVKDSIANRKGEEHLAIFQLRSS